MNGLLQNIKLRNFAPYFSTKASITNTILFLGICVLAAGFFLLDKSFHRIVFYLFLAFGLYAFWSHGAWRTLLRDNVVRCLLAFAAFSLVSVFWSEPLQTDRVEKFLKGAVLGTAFVYVMYSWFRSPAVLGVQPKPVIWVCYAFVAGAVVSVIISYGPLFISGLDVYRPGLIFRGSNPNIAGFLIGFAILLLIWVNTNLYHVKWKSWWQVLLCLGLFACLMVTQSRAALLGVMGAIVFCAAISSNWRMALFIVVVCFISAALAFIAMQEQLMDIVERGFNNRLTVWGYGLDGFANNLVFGRGIGEPVTIVYEYKNDIKTETSVHNILIGIALDTGLVGFMLFAAGAALALYRSAVLFIRQEMTLPLCLFVYGFIVGCFEFHSYFINLNREWLVWWLPLALMLAYDKRHFNTKC